MEKQVLAKGEYAYLKLALLFFLFAFMTIGGAAITAIVCGDIFYMFTEMKYGYYWFYIAFFIFVGIAIYQLTRNGEIEIYKDWVICNTPTGQVLNLPTNQISAVGIGKHDSLVIATSSGLIKLHFLENRDEIYQCILNLLEEEQNEKRIFVMKQTNAADELLSLKNLFEQNVATQK